MHLKNEIHTKNEDSTKMLHIKRHKRTYSMTSYKIEKLGKLRASEMHP
jgi:hypothetical protein